MRLIDYINVGILIVRLCCITMLLLWGIGTIGGKGYIGSLYFFLVMHVNIK